MHPRSPTKLARRQQAVRARVWSSQRSALGARVCRKGPRSTAPRWEHVRGFSLFSSLCNPAAGVPNPPTAGEPDRVWSNVV